VNNSYPVYEARVGALGSVRAWHIPDINTFCFTYFNGEDYTPLFLSEEAAYYTWAFLSMMHPEAYSVISQPSVKNKSSKCKPAKKKPTVKKRQVKAK
jgi:hypothetical protein